MINRILVVDDDENWCFISKRMLKKAGEGMEITTAKNGLQALEYLQTLLDKGDKLPELIFLDIKMPVMDGFEFLEEISKSESIDLKDTRIIICSSSMHPKDQERSTLYPVDGFINKPFTAEILNEILA
jgi:CheY-like chemotaxis protein